MIAVNTGPYLPVNMINSNLVELHHFKKIKEKNRYES